MSATALRKASLALALVCCPLLAQQPQTDPAKEADIRRLIELTGTANLFETQKATMGEQMRPLLERSLPDDPHKAEIIETFLERFPERLKTQDLIDRIVPIYDKHLTHEEIKGLIQFYQTPLGQRVIQVLPQVFQESQAAGREFGQEVGREVMMEVVREVEQREKEE